MMLGKNAANKNQLVPQSTSEPEGRRGRRLHAGTMHTGICRLNHPGVYVIMDDDSILFSNMIPFTAAMLTAPWKMKHTPAVRYRIEMFRFKPIRSKLHSDVFSSSLLQLGQSSRTKRGEIAEALLEQHFPFNAAHIVFNLIPHVPRDMERLWSVYGYWI